MEKNSEQPQIRATIPVPEGSDLRGFSYRGPVSEDHPENNEHFEMKAEEEDPDILAQEKAELGAEEAPTMADGMKDDPSPDDLEENNDIGAGPGAGGLNASGTVEEGDQEDVLEEVRGGLRADVADDIEYDDSDANAHRKVS